METHHLHICLEKFLSELWIDFPARREWKQGCCHFIAIFLDFGLWIDFPARRELKPDLVFDAAEIGVRAESEYTFPLEGNGNTSGVNVEQLMSAGLWIDFPARREWKLYLEK